MKFDRKTGLYVPRTHQSVVAFLQELLTKAEATQEALAERIKVSRQTVNNILCDRTCLTPVMAIRLQAVLACDAGRLLRRQAEAQIAGISKKSYNRLKPLLSPRAATAPESSKEGISERREVAAADW